MKTTIKIVSVLTVSLLSTATSAQNEVEALRYSYVGFGGTARYNGMGGAFGALGGDISCMTTNPAGLGRYTKSEFNMSLLYEDINSNTTYLNNQTPNGRGNFNLGSIGFVGTKKLADPDWNYFQFGLAYNRTNFFHNRFTIEGTNNTSSMADVFRVQADGNAPADLLEFYPNSADLAYQAYLIDPLDTTGGPSLYSDRVPAGIDVLQSRSTIRRGFMAETGISFAGNYRDKLYLGGTIGIPSASFLESFAHSETLNDPDSLTSLNGFTYSQELTTRGRGINFKLGAIFLPVDWVRIGLAVHTPTWMSFNDSWSSRMTTDFETGEFPGDQSVQGPSSLYSWRLKTPARFMGSVGVIVLKRAAIDVDVEYVDYSSIKMRSERGIGSGYNFSAENAAIERLYQGAVNMRAGAELRLKYFYLRGGYAFYQSPFKTGMSNSDAGTRVTSAGVGFKNNGFSIDLGVNLINYKEDIYPYDPVLFSNSGPAVVDTRVVRTSLTCGWRF